MAEQVILPVPETAVYIIKTKVNKLEEKFDHANHRNNDRGEHDFDRISRGWYIHLEGSTESIYLGEDPPPFEVGDDVEIRIRRVK